MYLDDLAAAIAAELSPVEASAALLRAYSVLVRVKGEDVSAADVHDAWAAWMADVDPRHPALRPFEELDEDKRRADLPFVAAVRAVARRQRTADQGMPERRQ